MFGRDRNQDRTPEDRARAAAARAERRAAREGRRANPLPTEAFLHSAPPPPDEPLQESEEAAPAELPSPAEPAAPAEPDADGPPPAAREPAAPAGPPAEGPLAGREPAAPAGPAAEGPLAGREPAAPAGPAAEGPLTGREPAAPAGPPAEGPLAGREPAAPAGPPAEGPLAAREPAAPSEPASPAVPDWAGREPAAPSQPAEGVMPPAEADWSADGEISWTGEEPPTEQAPRAGWNGAWDQIDWATPPEAEEPPAEPDPPAQAPAPAATAIQTAPPRAPRRPPLRRAAGGAPRGIARPAPPTRRWSRRVGALLALLAIGGALYAINAIFQPFHGDAGGTIRIRIPEGADAGDIGKQLAAGGVIDSATAFSFNATLTGRRDDLHSGDYTLAKDMSNGEALDALVKGPADEAAAAAFRLTIPEGRSRREIVPLVEDTSLQGSYMRASSARASVRRARRLGVPKGTKTLEGFLFPATYDLRAGQSAGGLVDKQLDAFADNFDEISLRYAKRKHLTRYDVVTIASMIEREAALARERPLIAAVVYNRLKRGMPLGIDATIRYATNNWSKSLRQSDLARDSAYNTRLRRGLPPTPIGNPGLSSLKAAAKPAKVSYLYYVVKPCGDGAHAFSSTEEGFDRDYRRYHRARASRGKSPSKC